MFLRILLKDFFLVFLSAALLILSFPDFNLGFLAWIGLTPLLLSIYGKSLKYSFILSFICGIFFFAGIFYWILGVPGYKPLIHHTLLGIYLGPFFGCWGLAFSYISTRRGIPTALLSAPFIWVSLEYIRSNVGFLSLPWAFLSHSQSPYPVVIQIASITGAYGISFMIVLVNAAIAAVILNGKDRSLRLPVPLLIATASLLFITLVYGYLTIITPIEGNKVKISLVQGNIEQKKKWDPQFAREIRKIYAELTEQVAKEQPALIIWPETATPDSITQNPFYYKEVSELVKNTGIPLLLGSAQHQKFRKSEEKKTQKYYNSAFLISPDTQGMRNQVYNKIRLFPFSEYLPYREIVPWSIIGIDTSGSDNYTPGKDYTVFQHPEFRFGVTICWENVFPELVRQFIRKGAQCIINLTNEAHFGKTAAPHQLVAISVFRAVENRVYVVRCANTGVSCLIDPYGRILERIKDVKGEDTFVRGTITGSIIPLDSITFYTRFGDWFSWLAIATSFIFLIVSFLQK